MLFKIYSGSGIRESVLEHRHGAGAALDHVLTLMKRGHEIIQIFNEGGERVSLSDLVALLDQDEAENE